MPELPEVETVRRGLTELVAGSQIRTVDRIRFLTNQINSNFVPKCIL